MRHVCSSTCECRIDLDAAIAALEASTRILKDSMMLDSLDLIETCYARVRGAKAKTAGALAAYRDHFTEPETA